MRKILITVSLFGFLAACGGPGENAAIPEAQPAGVSNVDIGDHVVHFSALVISQTENKSVTAAVTVKTVNLTGQLKNVTMRQIDEGDAIYYIGVTPVANRETLVFDISITPDGVDSASEVRFKRQFFTD